MIKFKCRKVDRQHGNTPIISDRELDEFAHAVLEVPMFKVGKET